MPQFLADWQMSVIAFWVEHPVLWWAVVAAGLILAFTHPGSVRR